MKRLYRGGSSSLRVCISLPSKADPSTYLEIAETRLLALIADISAVQEKATKAVESDVRSTVFDVWIETDGNASYTCGFFDGEMEGELVVVSHSQDGVLSIAD